jgi:hypothetical protein
MAMQLILPMAFAIVATCVAEGFKRSNPCCGPSSCDADLADAWNAGLCRELRGRKGGGCERENRNMTQASTTVGSTTGQPLISSDKVEGTSVYDPQGNKIGSIKRLMIEKTSGKVAYAVMSFGGFLGMGTEEYTIPWNKLNYDTSLGGYRTDISKEQLEGSPTFYRDRDYNWSDRERERSLYDYWGVPPYWGGSR